MKIDLNQCKAGQKLLSKHGMVLTYVEKINNSRYPHKIRFPNGNYGYRTDDGFVMKNLEMRLPEDHDIVEILECPEFPPKTNYSPPLDLYDIDLL